MRKFGIAICIIAIFASLAAADTIYLRDGRTLRGTVLGFIDGRFVIRVATSSGQAGAADGNGDIQFFDPRDIQRVEIDGRSLDEARFETHTISVTLSPTWVDSGVDVRRGQRVRIRASGVLDVGRRRIPPSGLSSNDPDSPLPNAPEGELIGAITDDPNATIMELGASREFVADGDGRIFLTANSGNYSGARGAYTVQVLTERSVPSSDQRADADGNRDRRPSNPGPRKPRVIDINVPGNSQGTDTGLDLRAGNQATITATGSVVTGPRSGAVSPNGGRVGFGSILGEYPVRDVGVGALIGFIRSSDGQNTQPFFVGSQQTITASVDGRLFLLINDDSYDDNSGSFSVHIALR
jgi:hypothetical protein